MENSFNEKAPDEKKKKELKTFIFTRKFKMKNKHLKDQKKAKKISKPEIDEINDNILLTFYYIYMKIKLFLM